MHRRSSKKRRDPADSDAQDPNVIAFRTIQEATADIEEDSDPEPEKNPAAVALGRLGGKKGGKARAEKLSPAERSAIAKKAAEARWRKHKDSGEDTPK